MHAIWLVPILLLQLAAAQLPECSEAAIRAKRIYGASPPVNYLLYALDPSLLVGLNFPLRPHEQAYLKELSDLPVIGGWFGQGRTPNLEVLAKVKPELTVTWNYRGNFGKIAKTLDKLELDSCALKLDRLEDYPDAFRTLGRITGEEQRAEALAADFERRLRDAERRRERGAETPPRVYYAEGAGGLETECSGSVHAELIERAGGVNVHQCTASSGYGMEQISFEQLLLYNPEVIIVFDPNFYGKIFEDERFARLDALRNRRVYLIPNAPVNWFDRPPSFMRVVGLEWLQSVLWPEEGDGKLVDSLHDFFALYYRRDMSPEAIRGVLRLPGGAQ